MEHVLKVKPSGTPDVVVKYGWNSFQIIKLPTVSKLIMEE